MRGRLRMTRLTVRGSSPAFCAVCNPTCASATQQRADFPNFVSSLGGAHLLLYHSHRPFFFPPPTVFFPTPHSLFPLVCCPCQNIALSGQVVFFLFKIVWNARQNSDIARDFAPLTGYKPVVFAGILSSPLPLPSPLEYCWKAERFPPRSNF